MHILYPIDIHTMSSGHPSGHCLPWGICCTKENMRPIAAYFQIEFMLNLTLENGFSIFSFYVQVTCLVLLKIQEKLSMIRVIVPLKTRNKLFPAIWKAMASGRMSSAFEEIVNTFPFFFHFVSYAFKSSRITQHPLALTFFYLNNCFLA